MSFYHVLTVVQMAVDVLLHPLLQGKRCQHEEEQDADANTRKSRMLVTFDSD
jgi:hypothetical protein